MIIGLDFDNTIVSYDFVFWKVALEKSLIPESLDKQKNAVRDYLINESREDEWTELQGYVYGQRMQDASMFEGVIEFVRMANNQKHKICIISHKTRTPYRGEPYDLHAAAIGFLEKSGLYEAGLKRENVYFELSKDLKVDRIIDCSCDAFIDDLPEIFDHKNFPFARKVLFDPFGRHAVEKGDEKCLTWKEITQRIL